MGISISLSQLRNACHMGRKCVKKCNRQEAHAAAIVAGEEWDMPCHEGGCYPADTPEGFTIR